MHLYYNYLYYSKDILSQFYLTSLDYYASAVMLIVCDRVDAVMLKT